VLGGSFKMVTCCNPSFSDAKSSETAAEEWERDKFMVMTQLWNSMEQFVSADFIFLDSAKDLERCSRHILCRRTPP